MTKKAVCLYDETLQLGAGFFHSKYIQVTNRISLMFYNIKDYKSIISSEYKCNPKHWAVQPKFAFKAITSTFSRVVIVKCSVSDKWGYSVPG